MITFVLRPKTQEEIIPLCRFCEIGFTAKRSGQMLVYVMKSVPSHPDTTALHTFIHTPQHVWASLVLLLQPCSFLTAFPSLPFLSGVRQQANSCLTCHTLHQLRKSTAETFTYDHHQHSDLSLTPPSAECIMKLNFCFLQVARNFFSAPQA